MSIEAMKQALITLEWNLPVLEDYGDHEQLNRQHKAITALRAAIEQAHGDWDEVEALRASLREHMAEIHRLRQWQNLTDDEIALICGECAASAHRADDLSYARAIEAKLKEKNT